MDSFDRILLEDSFDILLEDGNYLRLEIAPDLITSTFAGSAEAFGDLVVVQTILTTLDGAAEAYGNMTVAQLIAATLSGSAEAYGNMAVAQLLTGTLTGSAEAYGDAVVAQLLTGTMALAGEASADNWQMSYQVVSVRGVAYDYSGPYAIVRDESEGYV